MDEMTFVPLVLTEDHVKEQGGDLVELRRLQLEAVCRWFIMPSHLIAPEDQ